MHYFHTRRWRLSKALLSKFVDQHAQQLENIPLKTPIADLACKARVLQVRLDSTCEFKPGFRLRRSLPAERRDEPPRSVPRRHRLPELCHGHVLRLAKRALPSGRVRSFLLPSCRHLLIFTDSCKCRFPVLIAVDDYNMLFQKPRIFYEFESIDVTNHAFYNAVADVLPLDE